MAVKVLINLATGLEDGERVTVRFLLRAPLWTAARDVAMFLTKEAVRLAGAGACRGRRV